MNERIKELHDKAFDGIDILEPNWFLKHNKKFAELIVEEFDLILANEYLDCVGENDNKSQVRIDRLRNRVKKYFGVES